MLISQCTEARIRLAAAACQTAHWNATISNNFLREGTEKRQCTTPTAGRIQPYVARKTFGTECWARLTQLSHLLSDARKDKNPFPVRTHEGRPCNLQRSTAI